MAGYIRLQELTTVTTQAQGLDQAVDVGDYGSLVVRVDRPVAGSEGSFLVLQHAPLPADASFVDLCPTFLLNRTGVETRAYRGILRYVRWRAVVSGGAPQIQIDLVGREW